MRARPEPTQLEDLSHASFLGKLLMLPENVRQDWKVFARCKHSSLFCLVFSNEEKKFYKVSTSTFSDTESTQNEAGMVTSGKASVL